MAFPSTTASLALSLAIACSPGGLAVLPGAGGAAATCMNSIGMEFVLVPAGRFQMGTATPDCPQDDPTGEQDERPECLASVEPDEQPRHTVTIGAPFYLGRFEVTQEQWVAIMGDNPSAFNSERMYEDSQRHPVEYATFHQVEEFISKFSAAEGSAQYRLPSEAEWEYAARAGQAWEYAGSGDFEAVAWHRDNSEGRTHPVGMKAPNAWGLHDMSGNVWEWVADEYHDTYAGAPADGSAWISGERPEHVLRGGSWDSGAQAVRVAYRFREAPGIQDVRLGFRVVKAVP